MKPKFNTLITLLLLLGTFAFLLEAEQRIVEIAHEELSEWVSLLPLNAEEPVVDSINPYAQKVNVFKSTLEVFYPIDTLSNKEL